MDRYVAPLKFIQFQVWQDCKNGCRFCSEKQYPSNKLDDIKFVLNKLNSEEMLEFDEVGIIGGEFFDDQLEDAEVQEKFYEMCYKMCTMHFKKIYIATSLIYDMSIYFAPFLDKLREWGVADKVLICTSWDSFLRFSTFDKYVQWKVNMGLLRRYYSDFKTHIEVILTGHFIDSVLSGAINITELSTQYNSRIDFIEPTSGLSYKDKHALQKVCPNFFPTKEQFMKFIKSECVSKKTVDIRCLISYQIRASRVYHKDQGKFVCYYDRRDPAFKVESLDTSYKCDVGMIDSDESMESICTAICDMLPEEFYDE
jgi:hypothetical protein